MNDVIRTEKLSKSYKDVLAVSEISLNVRKGEIYGFLGLNGSGKTTTIRMLLGMISPDNGAAYINGKKVHPNNTELWKDIGYLVEVPYAYPDLTVKENLEIIRRLRLINDKNAVSEIMDKLQLTKYSNKKARYLSLGNAQRLGLAKALIHNPQILILDEPANGLDPAGIHEIRELLSYLSGEHGVTIFISSHILGEISKFSTRIGIIHDGRLIQEIGTTQLESLCKKRLQIGTKNQPLAKSILLKNNIIVSENAENMLEIEQAEQINHPEKIASLLVNNQVPLTHLSIAEEDLESIFKNYSIQILRVMKNISSALWSEYMKIRKSKILFATILIFIFIPMMTGFLMFVAKNPDIASKLGLIGTKANMFGENDWIGYLGLMSQLMATIGLLGFGFVTTWVFAREHTDRTMKDILALPVTRSSIVLAKFIIVFLWCILLSVVIYIVGVLMGQAINLPGWSNELLKSFTKSFFISAFLTVLLCSPVAYLAGYSRGIIAPLGFVILTMIMAQFVGLVGLGLYFPWAIPGLFAVSKDAEGFRLFTSSYFILALTFSIGYWGMALVENC